MSTQPEALRLAELLETAWQPTAIKAAAELRRLHAENEVIRNVANRGGHIAVAMSRIADLEAQRDALLTALKSTGLFLHHCWCDVQMNDYSFEKLTHQMAVVDAAIKAAEGEKT